MNDFKAKVKEARKLKNKVLRSQLKHKWTEIELLGWAMNQLFRAARTMELVTVGAKLQMDEPSMLGCDVTATVILKHLTKSKAGYKSVKETNPELLRGYRKP